MSNTKQQRGFSLIELMIGIILLIMVMGILFSITTGGIKNGKFSQSLADTTVIAAQKATELFNNISTEIESIPTGQNLVGSIDPSQPMAPYVDYLNESGCIIRNFTPKDPKLGNPPNDPPTKDSGSKGTTRPGLGDLGSDDKGDDTNPPNSLDCSKATFATTSTSTTPKFRRQWVVVKNKPNFGDVTVAVVLINQIDNSIIRSETLVKVDGKSNK